MSQIPSNSTVVGWSPGLTNVENQVKGLIAAAETNIERLTAQIHELTSLREKERSVLATLRLMIVPIGKLPTELLAEIFKLAVQTPVLHGRQYWRYTSSGLYQGKPRAALRRVLCLAQVSPYWKQIVHNTPALWAEGVIAVELNRELTDPYLSGLKTILARSIPYPISVSLGQDPTSKKTVSVFESWCRITSIILPSAPRWKNLSIALNLTLFNKLSPGTFQALERLYIRDSIQTQPVNAFQSSPRLQHFTLRTVAGSSQINLIHLPWCQLTDLEIQDESLGGCRAVLLQCTNLVSATLNTPLDWDLTAEAANSPTVVLPFLKKLSLTFYGIEEGPNDGLKAFFTPFSLPSLIELAFAFTSEDDSEEDWPTEVFSEFLKRSPNIEAITLAFSSIDSEGLVAILRHGPALRTLELENSWYCVNDDFFDALCYDEADLTPVAPKLEDLQLECVGEFDEGHFEAAILLADGSPPRVSRLKKLWVSRTGCFEGRMSDELKGRMQELVNQGLDFDLEVA
ncbi:hypothetical protein B0H13DRAFT_2065194 [Mycena leptocephala]|nr:hypothetical protein B0H13DRAFT_2065194 [Mycena leptocephala]